MHELFSIIRQYRLLFFLFVTAVLSHLYLITELENNAVADRGRIFCQIEPEIVLAVQIQEQQGKSDNQTQSEQSGRSEAQIIPETENEGTEEGEKEFSEAAGVDTEKWKDLTDRLEDTEGLREKFPRTFEDLLPDSDVSSSYIYRKRDYEDIIVKEVFPTLETIDKPFEDIVKKAPEDLKKYEERNRVIDDYRRWKKGELPKNRRRLSILHDQSEGTREVLEFPPEEREQYFDDTLPLNKEDQLNSFLRKFGSFDPDKGDLPVSIRELYYKNLQRLAYVFSSDFTYFNLDYYQENLNKEDFLKKSLYQVSRKHGTKYATEMLFALENIYEIQQRAWRFYFQFKSRFPTLSEEKKKTLRVETLRRVMQRYEPRAREKGLNTYRDAVKKYSKKREEIINYILQTTPAGYRRNDALFEKGRILWQRGRKLGDRKAMNRAVDIFSSIPASGNGDFLNRETVEALQPLIKQYNASPGLSPVIQIDRVIDRRLQKILEKKRQREDKLLWPDNSRKPPQKE